MKSLYSEVLMKGELCLEIDWACNWQEIRVGNFAMCK